MRTTALISAIGLLALVGCNDDGNDDPNDTSNTDDTDISYEDGCIDVSGSNQGFASLADAITVAESGATITLCEQVTVPVVVDKDLTILGNNAVLLPPPNDMAVTVVNGAALTLRDVEIQTTRSGILIEDGSLDADGIDMSEVAQYGVDMRPGTSATIANASIAAPDWGAFNAVGATLTVSNATVTQAGAFGVFADEGAVVTVENSSFDGIAHRDASTSLFDIDGVGVWVEGGSTVTMASNIISNAEIASVSVDGNSTLTMDGDRLAGNGLTFAPITARSSVLDATNVEITDYIRYGVIAVEVDELTLTSVAISTDPDASAQNAPDGTVGSAGIYAIESIVTVAGTEELPSVIRGNKGAGILVSPSNGGNTSELVMSNTIVEDNYARGVAVYSGEATLTDSVVRNTLNDDDNCITDTGYQCNMAMPLFSSSATLVNTDVTDSNDWGVAVVNGVLSVDGGTFARNEQNSLFGQGATVTATNALFDEGGDDHITVQQNGSIFVEGCTFQNGEHTSEFINVTDNEDGTTTTTRNLNYFQANDVYAFESDMTVKDSTFTNGERGITAAGGTNGLTAELSGLTFDGYNEYVVYGTGNVDMTLEDTSFTNIGRYAVNCYQCDIDMADVTIDEVTRYQSRFEYYVDDELVIDSEYDGAGPAMTLRQSNVAMENVEISGTDGQAIQVDTSSLEMDGVTVRQAVRDNFDASAVQISWIQRTVDGSTDPLSYPNAVLNGLKIYGPVGNESTTTDALRISGWNDSTTGEQPEGVVDMYDLLITGEDGGKVTGGGLRATNLGQLNITGFDVDAMNGAAIRMEQTSGTLIGNASGRTGAIYAPGGDGIVIEADRRDWTDASVTLQDITITTPVSDGVTVNQGTHSFTGLTVTDAGAWGAVCTDVTFTTCEATLSGVEGATDGCDACVASE